MPPARSSLVPPTSAIEPRTTSLPHAESAATMRPLRVVAYPRRSGQNPHMGLLYAALEPHGFTVLEGRPGVLLRHRFDLVHVHWPERLLNWSPLRRLKGLLRFLVEIALIRIKGGRLVWTVQNIKGHEERAGPASRLFRAVLHRNLAGFISLSHTAHELTLQTYPELRHTPSLVAPRGHYRDLYPHPPSREEARAALGLPHTATIVGAIGLIRRYKNLPHLLRCFATRAGSDRALLVAGECTDVALRGELEELAAADPRVRLAFRFIPEGELPLWIRALDLAVLPYREILNSGSALLALSLDIPVLAPAMGTLVELERAVGATWVSTYSGELDGAQLERAIAWSREPRAGRAPLDYFDWETNARATAAFFRSLIAGRR